MSITKKRTLGIVVAALLAVGIVPVTLSNGTAWAAARALPISAYDQVALIFRTEQNVNGQWRKVDCLLHVREMGDDGEVANLLRQAGVTQRGRYHATRGTIAAVGLAFNAQGDEFSREFWEPAYNAATGAARRPVGQAVPFEVEDKDVAVGLCTRRA